MLENGTYTQLRLIETQYYKEKKYSFSAYIEQKENKDEVAKIGRYSEILQYIYLNSNLENIGIKDLQAYNQLRKSKHNKNTRINERVDFYISRGYTIAFGTFTFNDEALKLNKKYRKELITRELNKNKNIADYIGNIDFGTKNEREHYHYILILDKNFSPHTHQEIITSKGYPRPINRIDNLEIEYEKGFYTIELVGKEIQDKAKVSKYITKLSLHAIKDSTGKTNLIYKRDTKYTRRKKLKKLKNNNYQDKAQEQENIKKLNKKIEKTKKEIEKLYGNSYEFIKKDI